MSESLTAYRRQAFKLQKAACLRDSERNEWILWILVSTVNMKMNITHATFALRLGQPDTPMIFFEAIVKSGMTGVRI